MEGLTKHLEEVRQQAAGVIDLVLADMRQKWADINSGPSAVEVVKGFVRSVDWAVSGTTPACWSQISGPAVAGESREKCRMQLAAMQ